MKRIGPLATRASLLLWVVALVSLFRASQSFAQDKISLKDAKEMNYQAQSTVEGLQNLMNYVTFSDITASELTEVVSNSYKGPRNQIFASDNVIIEDDLDPAAGLGKAKDINVKKYLDNLFIHYERTNDASIVLANPVVSKIKKKDYLFVKVRFEQLFGSKHKLSGKTYPARQREALVRLINQGNNKWQALIMGVNYYNPASPIESSDNEVLITTDTSPTASLVSQEDFVREKDDFVLAKQQEEKRKQAAYDEYLAVGDKYVSARQYKEALEIYGKARELKPVMPSLDKRVLDTRRLSAENTFESYKSRADQAKGERRYSDALQHYKEAVLLKPELHSALESEIASLTKKLDQIALPKNKVESGDYQGAIDACDEILKENKKAKNAFPEIFYLKGRANQLAGEKSGADPRSLDRALENYTLAVQYFPNYTDARLARAQFYVTHKKNYVSAITEYDVLTTNALDDSADKPKYFVVKGKWKAIAGNTSGALDDFAKAIALNRELMSAHFEKAELLYRLKRHSEALESFNTAVKLAPSDGNVYFARGKNYVKLNDTGAAGSDFILAEQHGLSPEQLLMVESISNSFLADAQGLFKAKKYARADSLFNHAIAIRKCNAEAWHGKAEIKLVTAEEHGLRGTNAKPNLQSAVELYQKALDCKPAYYDAHYKKGLAYERMAEYDLALKCFTDAIKVDASNAQAHAGRGFTSLEMKQYLPAMADYSEAARLLQVRLLTAKKDNKKELVPFITADLSQAYRYLGQVACHRRDFKVAILMENKALELNEKNAEAHYYKGMANEELNDVSNALKSYAEAIKYGPCGRYYHANGRASLKANKYDQAILNFNSAIKLDTLIKSSYYLRGLSYFKGRMLDNAHRDFSAYAKLDAEKKDSIFYGDFGMLNLYMNRDSAAIKEFTQALALKDDNSQALFGMGCTYAKAGQFEKALQQFEKAYQTRRLRKEDVDQEESVFLVELNKVKSHRAKYNQLKKSYLAASK